MNLNDLPTFKEINIDELKTNLRSICDQHTITKFEVDDIIELLEDGEEVDWIIGQLKSENTEIPVDDLTKLLTAIKEVVGPEDELEEDEFVEDDVEDTDEKLQVEMPDASEMDLSKIDLTQLGNMLPEGMQLPQGINMKQIQKLMDSPQGKFMTDFSMFCQEKGIDMSGDTMSNPEKMQELEAEWKSTPRPAFDGKTPDEMLEQDPTLMPQKVETFRRETPRIGRNDPCPCGSGKKYKKCCGRGH